jgi:hypothetical protein
LISEYTTIKWQFLARLAKIERDGMQQLSKIEPGFAITTTDGEAGPL